MGIQETEVLKEVAGKTNSELILFFILVIIAMSIVVLPLYRTIAKDRKERLAQEASAANQRQDKYIERERELLKVVSANTEVMAGLKTTLEKNGLDTTTYVVRIHERIDVTANDIGAVKSTIEYLTKEMKEMQDVTNKTFLAVNGITDKNILPGKTNKKVQNS